MSDELTPILFVSLTLIQKVKFKDFYQYRNIYLKVSISYFVG